jgi:hypothetical protein
MDGVMTIRAMYSGADLRDPDRYLRRGLCRPTAVEKFSEAGKEDVNVRF